MIGPNNEFLNHLNCYREVLGSNPTEEQKKAVILSLQEVLVDLRQLTRLFEKFKKTLEKS